jgi:putative SOS response-associated peptidase YedK
LVPADGFYEWKLDPETGTKIPTYIYLKDRSLFAFAGLFDKWKAPDGELIYSCTIITKAANQFMQPVHDRMPAILISRDAEETWLDSSETDLGQLLELLEQAEGAKLASHRVSSVVNSARKDSEACILKV